MPQPPRPRLMALPNGGVEIQSPAANRHIVVPAGGLYVFGETAPDVTKVWVKVLRQNDPIPADPSTQGFVEINVAGGQFSSNAIPGSLKATIAGNPDNKVVAIPQVGNVYGSPDVVYFVGRTDQDVLPALSAQACMWFAFAPGNMPGPGPNNDREASTDNHRPYILTAPANAGEYVVNANGLWRHFATDPATESDADGKLPVTALELPGYRSVAYNSEMIADVSREVNTLMGMFIDPFNAPVESPFPIGVGPFQQAVPDLANKLALAFHDGKRWHNNGGSVTITIDWIQLNQGTFRLRGL